MPIISERFVSILLIGTMLIFLQLNYDPQLGNTFLAMLVVTILLSLKDSKITIPVQRHNIVKSFTIGIIGYLAFLGISTIVIPSLRAFNLSSIIDLYSAASQPFFANNFWFTLISFGIVIPYIETDFFFGKAPEALIDWTSNLGVSWDLKNIKFWAVAALFVFLFVIMHITAKIQQVKFNEAMALIGLFALVSMVIVAVYRETLGSIFMHIIANTTSILDSFNIVQSTYVILGAIGLALLLMVIAKQFNLRIIRSAA